MDSGEAMFTIRLSRLPASVVMMVGLWFLVYVSSIEITIELSQQQATRTFQHRYKLGWGFEWRCLSHSSRELVSFYLFIFHGVESDSSR